MLIVLSLTGFLDSRLRGNDDYESGCTPAVSVDARLSMDETSF
ncbi:hypothetical protein [Desulfogranum mediterraneum]|nr:hypothetical protein [Desulfogranum mediterraneum]